MSAVWGWGLSWQGLLAVNGAINRAYRANRTHRANEPNRPNERGALKLALSLALWGSLSKVVSARLFAPRTGWQPVLLLRTGFYNARACKSVFRAAPQSACFF